MKTISKVLVGMLLAVSVAQAEPIAETKNMGGGKIVLTNDKCDNGTSYIAYSVMPNRSTITGCWANDDEYIHIRWSDGDLRSYPYSGWYMLNKKPNT